MIGYLAFAVLLFFPGFLIELLTGRYKEKRPFEVFASSVGISLVLIPLVLAALNLARIPVTSTVVGAIDGLTLLGSLALLYARKIPFKTPSLDSYEALAIGLVFVQAMLLFATFTKYPIFPISYSNDFRYHLQTAIAFQTGGISVAGISYPPAIHLWIATLLSTETGISLVLMQQALAIIGAMAPVLVYLAVLKMFHDRRVALAAAAIWTVSGVMWYTPLFVSGLYANFLANLDILVVLYLVLDGLETFNLRKGVLLLAAAFGLYLSHFTVVIFVAALWIGIPLVWGLKRDRLVRYLMIVGIISLPVALIALARPDLIPLLLSFPSLQGTEAGLAQVPIELLGPFTFSYFFQYVYVDVGIGLIALTILTLPIAVYYVFGAREPWTPLLIAWFAVTWVVTPNTGIAWRYSYIALIPLLLLWALALKVGLDPLVSRLPKKRVVRKSHGRPSSGKAPLTTAIGVLVLVVSGLLLFNSPAYGDLANLNDSTGPISLNQNQVYQAMSFVQSTYGGNLKVFGAEDWRFRFMEPMYADNVSLYNNVIPQGAYNFAVANGIRILMVSQYLVPGPFSGITGYNPDREVYGTIAGLELVYSNPSVSVYLVKS